MRKATAAPVEVVAGLDKPSEEKLRDAIERLRAENAEPRRGSKANEIKPSPKVAPLKFASEVERLTSQNVSLRATIHELKAKLKLKEGLPKNAAALQQQLLQAFHPDKARDPERKKILSDAFRIFNALKFRVRDE